MISRLVCILTVWFVLRISSALAQMEEPIVTYDDVNENLT